MKIKMYKRIQLQYLVAIIFLLLLFIPSIPSAEEKYVFERMWPTLQQPWYFYHTQGLAIDIEGNVSSY